MGSLSLSPNLNRPNSNYNKQKTKMNKTSWDNIKLLLISSIFTSCVVSSSQVVDSWKINEPGCEGSLLISDTTNQKITINEENNFREDNLNIAVASAQVEGCGCFRVFSGRKGKGASALIQRGTKLNQKDIGFKKIRSAQRVLCQVNAQPSWWVIVIVVASVVIVFGLVLIFIKCYRSRFARLPQDEPPA